jgi:hypothetical protein
MEPGDSHRDFVTGIWIGAAARREIRDREIRTGRFGTGEITPETPDTFDDVG